jgi:hypothetical protein
LAVDDVPPAFAQALPQSVGSGKIPLETARYALVEESLCFFLIRSFWL